MCDRKAKVNRVLYRWHLWSSCALRGLRFPPSVSKCATWYCWVWKVWQVSFTHWRAGAACVGPEFWTSALCCASWPYQQCRSPLLFWVIHSLTATSWCHVWRHLQQRALFHKAAPWISGLGGHPSPFLSSVAVFPHIERFAFWKNAIAYKIYEYKLQ